MEIYILGFGYFADALAEIFSKLGINVKGILRQKSFYLPLDIEKSKKIPTYYLEDINPIAKEKCNIIIAQKPIIIGSAIDYLRKNNYTNVTIVDEEILSSKIESKKDLSKYCYKVDFNRPFLNYLETNIVDHCNLNCKGCAHFSNICDRKFVSVEEFERDLKLVSQIFNLYYFRMLGGEPLLHPNISELVKLARKILIDSKIVIVTNGLLIDNLNEKILETCSENNITFCISVYKPTFVKLNSIVERLEQFNIKYALNDNPSYDVSAIEKFQTRLTVDKKNDGELVSQMCLGRFCRFLRNGKISKCYYSLLSDILNEKCGANYSISNQDYIDLRNIQNGWDAIDTLNSAIPFCNYCSLEEKSFDWEGNHKNDYNIEQYILKR